jgi:hypothetical protein
MHTPCGDIDLGEGRDTQKARFSLVFKRRLRGLLSRQGCAAEGFGIVWEQTLEEVPLDAPDQGEVYWELIGWAKAESYSQSVRAAWPQPRRSMAA